MLFMKLAGVFRHPIFLSVLFVLAGAALLGNKDELMAPANDVFEEAQRRLDELARFDPEAAAVLQRMDDDRQERALLVAAQSTVGNARGRSALRDMASEMAVVSGAPYRARLAGIYASDPELSDPEVRGAYFHAHATTCEAFGLSDDWESAATYTSLLQQARQDGDVWELVRDDPVALVLWSEGVESELLRFYARNRDWLADPLLALDLTGTESSWTLSRALETLSLHEKSLRLAVEEGELGVLAVAVMLTHGRLVDQCRTGYDLHPAEIISIVYLNGDVLDGEMDGVKGAAHAAAWLATIASQHAAVWLAAQETPLALRLYRDAPQVASSILEKFGADDVPTLIYQHFQEEPQVRAAAHALDVFGDLAIFVFARYDDEEFTSRLGRYLVDPKIGIRAIPFVIRFGDEAFARIEDDPAWVDRYFRPDGSLRSDDLAWLENIPLGNAVNVARNFAKGHPCEASELGWAALDVLDVTLAVASLGSSKVATSGLRAGAKMTARSGAQAARRAAKSSKVGTRTGKMASYRRRLATVLKGARRIMAGGSKLARGVRGAAAIVRWSLGVPIWGSLKFASATAKVAWRVGRKSLKSWKSLNPNVRRWIYRGLLGCSLFLMVTSKTLPNLDKIGAGVGQLIGEAAAGTVEMVGQALSRAVDEIATATIGESTAGRSVALWLSILGLWGGAALLTSRWFRSRRPIVVRG